MSETQTVSARRSLLERAIPFDFDDTQRQQRLTRLIMLLEAADAAGDEERARDHAIDIIDMIGPA